jgi:hypothetical protein
MEARNSRAAERDVRQAAEARDVKERAQLRLEILKRAKRLLKDSAIGLEEERGELTLAFETEDVRVPAKTIEGFDLDALTGDPEFRTETRRIGSMEYVVTERIKDRSVVRPDGHGRYPEKEDLQAALKHDLFLALRWASKHGISPAEAALIAQHHHRKPKEWLWRATEALLAADASLEPNEAVRRAGLVINDLIKMHRAHQERL